MQLYFAIDVNHHSFKGNTWNSFKISCERRNFEKSKSFNRKFLISTRKRILCAAGIPGLSVAAYQFRISLVRSDAFLYSFFFIQSSTFCEKWVLAFATLCSITILSIRSSTKGNVNLVSFDLAHLFHATDETPHMPFILVC